MKMRKLQENKAEYNSASSCNSLQNPLNQADKGGRWEDTCFSSSQDFHLLKSRKMKDKLLLKILLNQKIDQLDRAIIESNEELGK